MPNDHLYKIHEGLNKHEYVAMERPPVDTHACPLQVCACGCLSIDGMVSWQITLLHADGNIGRCDIYTDAERLAFYDYLTLLGVPGDKHHTHIRWRGPRAA